MTRAQYLGYGIGAAGSAGFGTVPGLILAVYLTDTLGVAAAVAAIVVLVPKVWDMLFLPIVGNWSDSAVTRRGGRMRFIAIGAFAMLLAFPLMFAVPAGTHSSVAALWVLVAFTLAATAYAFFQVPLGGRSPGGRAIDTSARWCEAILEEEEVALVPGSAFGAEGHVRMSFAASEEKLDEGLRRIERFIRGA